MRRKLRTSMVRLNYISVRRSSENVCTDVALDVEGYHIDGPVRDTPEDNTDTQKDEHPIASIHHSPSPSRTPQASSTSHPISHPSYVYIGPSYSHTNQIQSSLPISPQPLTLPALTAPPPPPTLPSRSPRHFRTAPRHFPLPRPRPPPSTPI